MSHMCTLNPCPICRPNAQRHAPSLLAIGAPRFNADALAVAECIFEAKLRPYQEGDGSYSCDATVIFALAVEAFKESA